MIQNITIQKESKFINPFYFFCEKSKDIKNIEVIKVDSVLKAISHPDLGAGIYINSISNRSKSIDTSYFKTNCNKSYRLYKNAAFEQFIHIIGENVVLNNIPVIADVSTGNYNIEEYNKNSMISEKERIKKLVSTSICPCQTVSSNSAKKWLQSLILVIKIMNLEKKM